MDKQAVLEKYFGYHSFRDGQEQLIDGVLSGRDAFGIMPTGGGKSLCYQVPAMVLEGIALVISPLISLMQNQVMALKNAGIPAAFINSSLNAEQLRAVYRNLRAGKYKILYIAPERLDGEGFVALAQQLPLSLVAVDEAHCISQWGQDFRPSYLRIVDFLKKLPCRPVLAAFTATATLQVRQDIQRILELRDPVCVTTGFDRPNLNFEVLKPKDRNAALHALVKARRGKSGIVYCATRKAVEQVCQALCDGGIAATRYHAGLPDEERRQNQEDFLYDRRPVMVATNAFGMGIDKSNVSFVIHYNMPKSLEAYYQEAGRAGRDGEKADCLLLFSPGDIATAKFLIQSSGENEELTPEQRQLVQQQDFERLKAMTGYCKTTACLRSYILEYFGQAHPEKCGNCGNCRSQYTVQDITREAQMILSCVKRIRDALGYAVGATLVVHTLHGSSEKRIKELGLDRLSTYGLLKQLPRPLIREYIDHLEELGYLRTNPAYSTLELTAAAGNVLFRQEPVEIRLRAAAASEKAETRQPQAAGMPDDALYAVLKALRLRLAQAESVPAYIVFSNATLADMARRCPQTMPELLEVSGVGETKAARYGAEFLKAIREYRRGGH